MRVYSQLVAAQLENKTSDYAGTVTGAIWLRTDTDKVKVSKNSLVRDVLINDDKLVVGNNGTAANNVRLHRGANTLLQVLQGSDTTTEGTLSANLGFLSSRQENYTSGTLPSVGNPGRVVWNSDLGKLQVDDGSTWQAIAAGGGSGGSGSGIDQLIQKFEQERYSIFTTPLENSGGLSAFVKPTQKYFEANLLKDYTSGDAAVVVVWNGLAVNDSDKNYDSATGWAAGVGSAATSVGTTSTAGQFAIGTAAIKFDKDNSSVLAGVRFDRTAQNLNLVDQTRAWAYVYLPSVTGLTGLYLLIYADSTSNYQRFNVTTDYAGNALQVGLNLVRFNVASGGTATGTGWDVTKMARYVEIGVDTTAGTASQVYTGVAFDALYFGYRYPERLRVVGSEFTIFNNSVRSDIKAATSNTLHDGPLTLSATVASNIAGGISGTSRGRVLRSTLLVEGDGLIAMSNDAGLSGAITTLQDVRAGWVMRGTIAGDVPVVIDAIATQAYTVTAVGGSTIDVADPENTSANLLNTDTMDIFRPSYQDGKVFYTILASRALTANSSASAGTTTLTLTTTSILEGDVVCKRHVTGAAISVVAENALESFSTLTLDSSPNGLQLLETAMAYPNPQSVFGHWTLGGSSAAEATRNQRGPGPALTVAGTLNYGGAFKNGRRATSGWSSSNGLYIPAGPSDPLDINDNIVQVSCWFFATDISSGANYLMTRDAGSGTSGQFFPNITSSGQLRINGNGGSNFLTTASGSVVTGAWNHIVIIMEDNAAQRAYVNGVFYSGSSTNYSTASNPFCIQGLGTGFGAGVTSSNLIADVIVWRGGAALTASQVQELYNQGQHRLVGTGPVQRYRYTATGQSGQRVTVKAQLQRSTTAIQPIIAKIGGIVT